MNDQVKEQLIQKALSEIWGYDGFRPFQRETVDCILEGKDSLTVLPTGGGKSLCYQLPAAICKGTAIVVSPLISLMEDQVSALQLVGVPAAYLNSSLDGDAVRHTKARMFRGELKLLYVSPERLLLDHFKDELKQFPVSFFAVDEAHCISQWGHDFRPEYKELGRIKEWFPEHSVHAFTATAPPKVQNEIRHDLRLQASTLFVGSYYRPNLFYRVIQRKGLQRQLLELVKSHGKGELGIIYCLTRKETERIADVLCREGYKALPYHAGLTADTRKHHQALFSQEKVRVMVATVAFGMGIDQSNVRFVIHAGMPRSLAHYQQESGRAGRDGLLSHCTLIWGPGDIQFWKRIIEEESLPEVRLQQLRDMVSYAQSICCRHRLLTEFFGQEFQKPTCDGCDVCRGEVEALGDSRLISRQILSGVLKVHQNFGAAYVAQVLTGSKERKILHNAHDRLSVYGILAKYNRHQVQDWILQLENQGYLQRDGDPFPVVRLTEPGFWLLRPDKFNKKEDSLPITLTETRKTKQPAARPENPAFGYDGELFEKLRQKRREIASSLGVPAFIVFGDRSLQDMARIKPRNAQQFLQVFGVGSNKLEQFGAPMIEVICRHAGEEP